MKWQPEKLELLSRRKEKNVSVEEAIALALTAYKEKYCNERTRPRQAHSTEPPGKPHTQ